MKLVAVCVVNYNTRELLRDCLHSVVPEHPAEIVVVDNGSTDGSAEMMAELFPSIKFIQLRTNNGYGAAANHAIAHATADHIILLNSDTRLKQGAAQALSDYLAANECAAVVGPRMVYPDGSLQTSSFHFPTPLHIFLYLSSCYRFIGHAPLLRKRSLQTLPGSAARQVPWVLGAALIIHRRAFQAVGGFDESFFMYFEEVDLCYRLGQKGWQIHFAPVTEVVHVGGASTRQYRAEMNVQYFSSLARFYRKHYSRLRLAELTLVVNFLALVGRIPGRLTPSLRTRIF
jgi:GT2 family glycosyltransferase